MNNPFKNLSRGEQIAVAGGGVVVLYFVWKQHKSSAAASTAAASTSAIDPLTGLPTSEDNTVDPLTGQTYLAEAQQYGSVSAAEAQASSGGYGYGSAYGGGYGAGYGYGSNYNSGQALVPANTVQGTAYATNAAWAQAVEAGLTDLGYAP